MAASEVQHVTPDEESLSSISVNISCPQGCPRTFANSSALRLHLSQVHHLETGSNVAPIPGTIWYHCPVTSCVYHIDFGVNGRHFPKLKYLKQHYLKVHAARSHACDCGQAFSTAALLARHRRACGVKLLCCCGRSFSSVETLQTHARRSGHAVHHSTVQALRYHSIDDSGGGESSVVEIINTSSSASPSVQSTFGSVLPTICPAPSTFCSASSTFSQVTPLHLQQPTHLLAAIALSELAATAMKRLACVDVGVQTDAEVMRRSRRKSSSPAKCWESARNSTARTSGKRKRTAETQTRLTHRDSKRLQSASPVQLSGAAATVSTRINSTNNDNDTSFIDVSADECNDEGSFESLALQVDLPEFITTHLSNSGTQTSPRVASLSQSHLHNLTISLFDRACGDDEPGITPPSVTTITSTQTPEHLDPFTNTQLLIEDDEDLLGVVSDATVGTRRPPPLGQIRSSSIETQTDHDVLLSKNADTPDDSDEIILTTTETQTDPSSLLILNGNNAYQSPTSCHASGSCQVHDNDSLWCTSETQTYEDFSDIEQFMRSTIHTQTPDHSHSELFPELSFTHTQTQTSLDDPPALVTTHTQTPTSKPPPPGLSEV
ncbi:ATM interactor-like [Homarus americanus]|uniref:ATM interactor-like n=1 Tax=Homarus americanus TaxID=6706 RepID=A0A8J5JRD8_HOMAM|nr:ATM interactor-like [Homarus americanus]